MILLVAGLSGVGIWQATSRSPSADPTTLIGRSGQLAPVFSLLDLRVPGHTVLLTSLRKRPLVLNFWASWCVPCRAEMPLLEEAYRAHHGRVAFVGIDSNDTPSAARAFLRQVHVTYPVLSDNGGQTSINYGLYGLPTTVFISPSGKIVGRHIGELQADTLAAALSEAFHA